MPDAAAVYLPSPSTARLKIAPHMTEVQRPQRMSRRILTGTASMPKDMSDLNTGILTIDCGRSMALMTSSAAMVVVAMSIVLLDIYPPIEAPMNRPTSMRNQYVPTMVPATAVSMPRSVVIYRLAMLGIPTSTPT